MKVYGKMNVRDTMDQANPLIQPTCLRNTEKGQNFVNRVKIAYCRANSFVDFFGKFALIVFEATGWVLIVLLLAIPVSMIVVGTLYLHECKRQPYIPIYLIVGGCFGVVKNILNLIQSWVNGCGHKSKEDVKTNPLAVVLSWFLLAWFITGSVWIYQIYNDFDIQDTNNERYCHRTLYLYSFWITTVTYAFTALACFGFCVITSLVLSFDSDATKASLMSCFGNILWILYWYFTRYEAVAWPGFRYRGNIARQRLSCAESDLQQTV